MGEYVLTFADYDNEKSIVRFPTVDLTAGNIVAQLAAMDSLRAATEGIALGALQSIRRVVSISPQPGGPASSQQAQRERKWLVRYHDSVSGVKARVEIPCADATHLDTQARGFANMDDAGDVAAFVTAFEAVVLGPTGNAAVIDSIELVGRSL